MLNSLFGTSCVRKCVIAPMAALLLSACMVGPDYRRPEIDVPPAWRVSDNEAARISNIAWWDQFEDPVLSSLVRAALANNKAVGKMGMGGQDRPIDSDLGGALFADGGGAYNAIGALPLAEGYSTTFRNFDVQRGVVRIKHESIKPSVEYRFWFHVQ